jgi:hypothetical protein
MATITITPGESFDPTETVTSTKLNDLGSPTAALTAASIGTADIADDAITPALIADDAITTPAILDANVTFAKLADVIDSDTMTGATATTLATSESIKAYVDTSKTSAFTPSTYAGGESVTLPNNLIMKFGSQSVPGDSTATVSFATDFPSGIVQVQLTIKTTISLGSDAGLSATSQTVSGFTIQNGASSTETISWMAIGY